MVGARLKQKDKKKEKNGGEFLAPSSRWPSYGDPPRGGPTLRSTLPHGRAVYRAPHGRAVPHRAPHGRAVPRTALARCTAPHGHCNVPEFGI